ncbi:MAG TPA: EAL domain-containing protein [Treponemataceae bacterium]|nr:EAL domain-containing protein [Treponemataceae bacterium]
MLKKYCAFISFLLLCALCLISAENNPKTTIKIGFLPNYGISFHGETNKLEGHTVEYFAELSKFTGWSYEFVPLEWEEGLKRLKDGSIDFFGPMQKTPSREKDYLFSNRELGFEHSLLYAKKDSPLLFQDFESFQGIRIASFPTNAFNEGLEDFARKNNFSYDFVLTESDTGIKELQEGKFDALLYSNLVEIPNTTIIAKVETLPYYFATAKKNSDLIEQLNEAMADLDFNKPYFTAELTKKYFNDPSINNIAFSKNELNFIKDHPVLRVVHNPNLKPVEFFNSKTKKHEGISISILKELSSILGITFESIESKSYAESIQMIQDGKVDLITGYAENAKNYSDIQLSDTYYEIPVVLLKKQKETSKTLSAAIPAYYTYPVNKIKELYGHYNFALYEDSNACLEAFLKQEVDATFINSASFDSVIKDIPLDSYFVVYTGISYPLQLGLSPYFDTVALSTFNKAITKISEETKQTIVFSHTLKKNYNVDFLTLLRQYVLHIIIGLVILFLLFGITILYMTHKSKKRLQSIAFHDEQTGLLSLSKFKRDAHKLLYYANENDYMMMSLDIDNFKYINQSYGYEIGTVIISNLGLYLKDLESPQTLVCRSHNDVFLIFMKRKPWTEILSFFDNIVKIKNSFNELLSENHIVTFSAGVYTVSNLSLSINDIIDKATIARKSIKGLHHTSQIVEFTEKMEKEIQWHKEITLTMNQAYTNNNFVVNYQPKFLIADNSCVGAEALIRWKHDVYGLIPPNSFIPFFEKNGFIQKIDLFVFESVCKFLAKWQEVNGKRITISCNLSRLHLQNPELPKTLLEIANRYNVSPSLIELELTESLMHKDPQKLIDIMNALKKEGFKISIDDFGSGYSSLNLLKDIPADTLKIDKAFLSKSNDGSSGTIILSTVMTMARELNLSTIAEGVETIEEVNILKRIGCEMVQGFYYARPMEKEQFFEVIAAD